MVQTSRVKVLNHSETSEPELTTPRAEDQVGRRLLTGLCVGHLILSAVATAILGVYVSEHVTIL